MLNLQTTVAGIEITLSTLAEISQLIARLDERLLELSPELPRINTSSSSGEFSCQSFSDLLLAYQEAFSAFEAAARAASALGFHTSAPAKPSPQLPPLMTAKEDKVDPAQVSPPPEAKPVEETVSEAPEVEVATPHEASPVLEPEKPKLTVVEGKIDRPAAVEHTIQTHPQNSKPLKPIEMPSSDQAVGPMICKGSSVVYVHGSELKKYWPGAATVRGKLDLEIAHDPWRLLITTSSVFCAGDESVSVHKTSDLHRTASIPGRFLAQGCTRDHWVGVREDNGVLSTVFRDKDGSTFKGGEKLGEFFTDKVFLETSDDCAIVALSCGEVFKVDCGSVTHLANAGKYVEIAGLAIDSQKIFITNRNADDVWLTMLDHEGKSIHRSAVVAKSISHAPIIAHNKVFLFDDARSELVTLSTDSLEETRRDVIGGVTSIKRLIAMNDEDGGSIIILAQSADARPTAALIYSVRSGETSKICQLNAANGDIAVSDGHLIVSSTSAMQNLIQVFDIGGPVMAKAA